jgi:sec-independent protein translocase protein TatB
MLGVGWTEMLVIGVVALIVIGPKDLPVVMQRIGRFAGMIRRMGNEFSRELNRTTGLNEVKNLRDSITAPLRQTTEEIRREFNAMTATGVKPTGALAPKDPQAESVVAEIHEAAGMAPPEKTLPAPVEAASEPVKARTSRARKPAAAAAAKPEPVKAARRPRTVKAAAEPSPAPLEAAAPATRKSAKPAASRAPAKAITKTAARPAATRKKPAAQAAAIEPAAKPARKPRTAKADPSE